MVDGGEDLCELVGASMAPHILALPAKDCVESVGAANWAFYARQKP